MKTAITLILTLILFNSALADIRIFNGTSEDFKVDILSEHAQQRDVVIPARSLSGVLGAKGVPPRTEEIVVYKDMSGKEISRDKYWHGAVFLFGYHSESSFRRDKIYSFKTSDNSQTQARILNGTGKRVKISFEKPNFETEENTLLGLDSNAWGVWAKNVVREGLVDFREEGVSKEVTFTSEAFEGSQKATLTGGRLYFLDTVDGKFKLTQLLL